jgi:hypothetical protein
MVDRYMKGVLTVIAAALVTIVAQHAIHPSQAAPDIQKVQICDDLGHCAAMTSHVEYLSGGGDMSRGIPPRTIMNTSWVLPVAVVEIPSK